MASVAPPRVLQPLGHLEIRLPGVSSISANRDVVAVAVERPEKCGKVLLWAPRSRRISAIAGGCSAANGYNSISDLVLGRTVVAWVFSWGDRDSGSDCLMIRQVSTARIGRAITRKKHACNADYYGGFGGGRTLPAFESVANGGTTGAEGDLLTSLQTTASGIVYSVEGYCNVCLTVVPQHVERSWLVSPGGAETLLAGPGVRIVAAAGDVVAAVRSNSLDVLDLGTQTWRKISDGPVRAARADGETLFVLRPKGFLETYDLRSGHRIAAEQLGSENTPVQLEDADGVFVVYVSNRQIHVRRTLDRKDVVLALPRDIGTPLHAEIEPMGLYYSYNIRGTGALGRVGFVGRSRLVRAFGA
jgi:hypothetical protein